MKKIICLVLLVLSVFVLAGCSSSFTCDICQEEKSGKKHTVELFGEKLEICDECYKTIDEGFEF